MDEAVQGCMKKKFDICYVMAKESLGFRKYLALHELEERHGVDLGFAYKNDVPAQTFTHYIAESQRQSFLESFSASNFYSFLVDGSTDAGNVEDELILVQYCTQDAAAQEMRSCVRYLSLEVPMKADADGLIKCVGNASGGDAGTTSTMGAMRRDLAPAMDGQSGHCLMLETTWSSRHTI